ncbi:transmembrane 220 family protein [Pontibacter rugosus]|uniref:Transmembrane 220 family protein n=1 Tax=Pontibacter rugosus TaxID=1745966 RepID=A0ABW3SSH0_9BACT
MLFSKLLAFLFGLAFLSFVVLQYNDPDPALWMAVYGVAAILCFMTAVGKLPPRIRWSAAMLYTAGAILAWPERFEGIYIGGGDIKNIEEAREALGLLLCATTFTGLFFLEKYQQRRTLRFQQLQKARWAN